MALVSTGWYWSVTLIDNGGNKTSKTYQLQSADATEAAIDAAAALGALNGVTDAAIVSHHFYQEFAEDALVLPGSGVQIENLALMEFTLAVDPTKMATHTIPAPAPAIFVAASGPGANVLDTGNAQLAAYADLFTDDTDPTFFISDGEQALTFNGGRRIHRKSRRG